MSNFSSALIPVALLIGLVAFLYLVNRFAEHQSAKIRSRLDPFDFVVFEAAPSHLADLEADLADHRWRLLESKPTAPGVVHYRFEKIDSYSASLSKVLDFRTSMKRTGNRKLDPDTPIKIKAHGIRSERHG